MIFKKKKCGVCGYTGKEIKNGGIHMNWVMIIVIAVLVELVIRYFTRDMEDKRKREKILSGLWLALAIGLVIYWFVTK